MSFFGFNTALPRDKGPIEKNRDDPFDPTDEQDEEDDDAAFEEKLRGLTAGAQEDVEIYTWGGGGEGGYDGLGDLLEEAGDDLNNDTFGFGGAQDVGKDFDFSGTGGASAITTTTSSSKMGQNIAKTNDAAFASSLDDFWFTPSIAAKSAAPQLQSSIPVSMPEVQQQQQQRASAPRTMEEIEAELRASHQQMQQPSAPVSAPVGGPRLTLEEVEAEMLARRNQAPPPPSALPGEVSNLMNQSPVDQQQRQMPASNNLGSTAFPPLGSQTPPRPQGAPPAPLQNDAQSQQAHLSRMRALLEALPPPLQGRILTLPPYMQFGAVESIAREFPALTIAGRVEKLPQQIENPTLWPRADGSPEEISAIRLLIESAFGRLEEAEQMEKKRQARIAKINAMSRYNNLMTLSDKDFITRIQVSQLVTSDPYTDDFYAHIFFALRGKGQASANPGLMGKTPLSLEKPIETTPTAKNARQKKQQPSRRENAMLRMQQQVERIVQNRKERVEKSAQGAALEGALGRISLSNTKTPRQMLQVDAVKDEGTTTPGKEVGTGHAQDAVRQALKGASLGNDGAAGLQKRPPLTKLEVLSILENLYDVVLSLEQSRRNAPVNATEGDEGEAKEWRQNRDELTAKLWMELRVLEPLEISDPHPFVSLLSTVKGKRLLPRALRHLSSEQTLTAMTMIVASFDSLDVVKDSMLLDEAINSKTRGAKAEKRSDVQRQTEAFATSIVPSMLTLMTTAPMQIVSGMLALFIERNDAVRVAQSKAGVAFLTIFLSRAETLRQQVTGGPNAIELSQWSEIFNLLTQRLTSTQLTTLFPSTRAKASLPFGTTIDAKRKNQLELEDQTVWQLMAALAVSADMNQQQLIVTGLREKILENVLEAKQWRANNMNSSSDEGDIRIRNVNLLLHALNLDAAQITV